MSRTWKKLPPDGTHYAYWESDDGFVIETKPRFRPSIPYSLFIPSRLAPPGSANEVQFQTLAEAQRGAAWPLDALRNEAQKRAATIKSMCPPIANGAA